MRIGDQSLRDTADAPPQHTPLVTCLAAVHRVFRFGARSQPGNELSAPPPLAAPSPGGLAEAKAGGRAHPTQRGWSWGALSSSAPRGGGGRQWCQLFALPQHCSCLITYYLLPVFCIIPFFLKYPKLSCCIEPSFSIFAIGLGVTSLLCLLPSLTNFQPVQGSSHTRNKPLI